MSKSSNNMADFAKGFISATDECAQRVGSLLDQYEEDCQYKILYNEALHFYEHLCMMQEHWHTHPSSWDEEM